MLEAFTRAGNRWQRARHVPATWASGGTRQVWSLPPGILLWQLDQVWTIWHWYDNEKWVGLACSMSAKPRSDCCPKCS